MRRSVATAVALAGLVAAGWPSLRPPSFDPHRLWTWAHAVGAARTVGSAVWLAALAVGVYLTLVGLAMGICRCLGYGRALGALGRLVPGPFRLVLCATVGLSAAAGVGGPAGASSVPGPPVLKPVAGAALLRPAPALRRLPVLHPAPILRPPVARRVVPVSRPVSPAPPVSRPVSPVAPAVAPAPRTISHQSPARTWVIRPGDSLWLVAQQTLATAWGYTPETRVVARYWWTLVEMNRPHLPDPANPDLVFPGDVITLPPIPGRGRA